MTCESTYKYTIDAINENVNVEVNVIVDDTNGGVSEYKCQCKHKISMRV